MGFNIEFRKPAGPVAAAFARSRGPIDIIMGPAGSGKTVASCEKAVRLAGEYMPICRDGWVRFKIAVVRDTYRDFARTALASWHEMFPIGNPFQVSYEGGQDRPIKHRMHFEVLRGRDLVKVDFMLETGAVGDHNVEAYIKGYELSAGWGNEVDLLDPRVPGLMFQRTGRYPPVKDIADRELERVSRDGREAMRKMGLTVAEGEIVLPRVFYGDMNPPDIDHPILVECGYGEHADKKNPAYNFFHQPGGLDPNAENPIGKPRSSYELEAKTQPEHIVRRMVHGLPGYVQDGKPVYPEFNQRLHVSLQNLEPTPGLGLTIGIDGGGSPAATIGQPQPNGQDRLLAELVTEPGTGPTRFGMLLIELLMQRFPGTPLLGVYADPSAFYGGDKENDEFNFILTVQKILRCPIMPAPSNEPGIRHDAVRWGLTGLIDGVYPRYLIDPRCKKIIGGFGGHYKLTKQASVGGTDKLAVVKNTYSHPHDAEQYRVLGYRGLSEVISAAANAALPPNVTSLQEQRQRRQETRQRPGDFNVWDV